jgi:tRNA dimethylallyltransferase
MATKKTIIIIAGPTAVGKTSVAIQIAKHFNTEIISADSRQCYKELKIGVARPSEKELAEVKHHFIASNSIHQKITAATFEKYALQKAAEIFQKHDVAIMVGGTGLYIKAFIEGMDPIPEVSDEIRSEIAQQYKLNGIEWLQQEIKNLDPQYYEAGEIKNPQRLMRALEVFKATGKSIIEFKKGAKAKRDFDIVKLALELSKEQLHHHINTRVDQMMEHGLLDEVRSLIPQKNLNALQTVGYKELFEYFDDKISLENAVETLKTHTKQYAKRQMTWFKKDEEYEWFNANEFHLGLVIKHRSDLY